MAGMRDRKRRPTHLGAILREVILPALDVWELKRQPELYRQIEPVAA